MNRDERILAYLLGTMFLLALCYIIVASDTSGVEQTCEPMAITCTEI